MASTSARVLMCTRVLSVIRELKKLFSFVHEKRLVSRQTNKFFLSKANFKIMSIRDFPRATHGKTYFDCRHYYYHDRTVTIII